jgi:hypothetical protein
MASPVDPEPLTRSMGVGTLDDPTLMDEPRDELMYIGTTCIGVEYARSRRKYAYATAAAAVGDFESASDMLGRAEEECDCATEGRREGADDWAKKPSDRAEGGAARVYAAGPCSEGESGDDG